MFLKLFECKQQRFSMKSTGRATNCECTFQATRPKKKKKIQSSALLTTSFAKKTHIYFCSKEIQVASKEADHPSYLRQ